MTPFLRSLVLPFFALLILQTIASAHTPVDFLEVISVQPARPIEHGVELKSRFDKDRVQTLLEGPHLFSRSIGGMNRPAQKVRAYLNWFKIAQPPKEPIRELIVLDMVRGSDSKILSIQSAEYLLSPSQRITTGNPDPVPDGLDHYKAYRIVDAPSLEREITLSGSGTETRKLGKPLFVCLAVQQWHHDDYVAASHPNDCFVVYELDIQEDVETVSTMDQFGLNELQTSKSQWLCVRAALLGSK